LTGWQLGYAGTGIGGRWVDARLNATTGFLPQCEMTLWADCVEKVEIERRQKSRKIRF
jgi:hypothetical protein